MLVLAQSPSLGQNLVSSDSHPVILHDPPSPKLNCETSVDKRVNKHNPSSLHQRPRKEEHLLISKRQTEEYNASLRKKKQVFADQN